MRRSVGILALLIGTLLFSGCKQYWTPDRDKIPVPMRPEWCAYKGKDMKGGVWFSAQDNDTLIANIEGLRVYCDKLEVSVYIHNGEKPPDRKKGRK